jgi:hypothetical protein
LIVGIWSGSWKQAESTLEAERILQTAGGNQDSSKATVADTWAGKEKGSAEGSDESWV